MDPRLAFRTRCIDRSAFPFETERLALSSGASPYCAIDSFAASQTCNASD